VEHYAIEVAHGTNAPIRITATSSRSIEALQRTVEMSLRYDSQVDYLNIAIIPINKELGFLYPSVTGITLVMKDGTQDEILPLRGKSLGKG